MGARRDGMQDVELVDVRAHTSDEDGPGGDEPATPHESAVVRGAVLAARWARRHWRVLAVLAVVVAVAVGGVQVQRWRAERAYLASLVGRPGILAPLDASTSELWRTDAGLELGLGGVPPWVAVGDTLVGAGRSADGMRVVGLDGRTGETRWDLPVPTAPGSEGFDGAVLVPGGATSPDVLVYTSAVVWSDDEDGGSIRVPAPRVVLVVDAARGELVGRHDVGNQVATAALDAGLVVAETQPDGHVRVTLRDPMTWEAIWTHDTLVPAPVAPGSADSARAADDPGIAAAHDRVAVETRDGAVDVVSEAGVLVDRHRGLGSSSSLTEVGGHLLQYQWSSPGTDATLLDLASGRSFEGGSWQGDAVSDGEAGPTFVSSGAFASLPEARGLDLLDLDAGRSLSLPVDKSLVPRVAALVRGRVLVVESGHAGDGRGATLSAYDGVTGTLRWRTELRDGTSEDPVSAASLTDGLHVLLVEGSASTAADAAPGWRLTAFSTSDGHRAWDITVPDGVVRLVALGGRLYGFGESGEVVALG